MAEMKSDMAEIKTEMKKEMAAVSEQTSQIQYMLQALLVSTAGTTKAAAATDQLQGR